VTTSQHDHTTKVGTKTYRSSKVTDPDPSKAIADAIAAHEKAYHQAPPDPTPPPTPTPPPSTGIPAIPADHELFLRDFSDGQLVEFRKVTYLDSKPLDGMRYATDYTHPIEWPKDGDRTYLRERCIRQPNGRYNGTFLTTGGGMGAPTFSMMRGYVEFAFRLPGFGIGVGPWPAPGWLRHDASDGTWSSRELDLAEGMEDGKLRFTLHGFGADQVLASLTPGDIGTKWHTIGAALTDTGTTVTFDGKRVGGTTTVIDRALSLLTDAKAGFPWQAGTPNAQSPAEFAVELGWVRVTAKIPAGL
jgi:hypothetical protein